MFYETISSVDREGVSHFRRGLPFYLKYLFGNYSPFMFQFYQRLGLVRWVCSHGVEHYGQV